MFANTFSTMRRMLVEERLIKDSICDSTHKTPSKNFEYKQTKNLKTTFKDVDKTCRSTERLEKKQTFHNSPLMNIFYKNIS